MQIIEWNCWSLKINSYICNRKTHWKDAGVVDRAALEMRCTGNCTGGSNPSLSAKIKRSKEMSILSASFCFLQHYAHKFICRVWWCENKSSWFINSLRSADFCKEPAGEARERRAALALRSQSLIPSHNFAALLRFFSLHSRDSFSRWRLGRLVCVGLLFAVANLCLCLMIIFENKFSAIISQSQQSSIATVPLRSPLDCCDRSNLLWEESRWLLEL